MAIKPKVLFLGTGNSGRTRLAEAFLRELTADEFEIVSARAEGGRLDADAVAAMREVVQNKFMSAFIRAIKLAR